MRFNTLKGFMLLVVIVLFVPFVAFAQDNDDSNIVTAITLTLDPNVDGSVAEYDSLTALFDKNVVSKNKFVKSIMRVSHLYGANSGEFVIITEYNGSSLSVIEDAGKEGFELFKKWKKDTDDRAEFNKARNKYFLPRHSDEIYTLISKVNN